MRSSARTQGSWANETIVVDGLDLLDLISTNDDAETASLPTLIEIACRNALADIDPEAKMFNSVTLPVGDDVDFDLYEVIASIGENYYQRFEVRVLKDELMAWCHLMEQKDELLYGLVGELNALTSDEVKVKTDYFRPLFEIQVLQAEEPRLYPIWESGPTWSSNINILRTTRWCREFLTARAQKAQERPSEIA